MQDTARLSNSGHWSNLGDEAESDGQARSSSLRASILKEDDPGGLHFFDSIQSL